VERFETPQLHMIWSPDATEAGSGATKRFLEAGSRRIRPHTEAFRLAAVRSYLKVGHLPVPGGRLGGRLAAQGAAGSGRGHHLRLDGWDPEGNVFQWRQRQGT
jgi:hypothetical protein